MQALFAGTFDPPTRGHLDLITRAAKLCQHLFVAVNAGTSESKKPLFSIEERLALLKEEIATIPNVEVVPFSGLLTEFAKSKGIHTIIRGVRNSIDWDYETQLAYMNSRLYADLEVVFLAAKPEYAFVRASWVREIAAFGGDVSAFVTPSVAEKLLKKR